MSVIPASILGNCINQDITFNLTRRVTGHFTYFQESPNEPQRIAIKPYSIMDGHQGNYCSVTGNYYPGHRIINVDGIYFGDDVATQLFGPRSTKRTRVVWNK